MNPKDREYIEERMGQVADEINETSRAMDTIDEQIEKEGDIHGVLHDLKLIHEKKLLRLGCLYDNLCAEYMPKDERPEKTTFTDEELTASDTEGEEWKQGGDENQMC